ncbi:hypothetical protein [Azospirillum thermophilum]|uniref:hypothetical protein n=1 Tax=Azospirillum thermophilum TaxID=2202148 RepID=UPI0011B36295|nr:hypothetical protein [Azospirillum thermophilum]
MPRRPLCAAAGPRGSGRNRAESGGVAGRGGAGLRRAKQLEYLWPRSLTGRRADFRTVTRDAPEAHGLAEDPALPE